MPEAGRRRGSQVAFHLFTVLAVVACILLARWQWQRAHRTNEDAVPDTPAVAWAAFSPQDSYSGQRISVTGRYSDEQILISPRPRDGRPGSWVYTPLVPSSQPASDDQPAGQPVAAIGVIRGWVPDGTGAADLEPPTGEVTVTGILVADERRPATSPTGASSGLPSMVRVDSAALAAASGQRVRAGWLALTGTTPQPSSGQPTPLQVKELPGADVGLNWRNAAYAVQWLVFAGFAVFFWNRFRRDYFDSPRVPEQAAQEGAEQGQR